MQQLFVLTPMILGVIHAFDADHIAAVSALVAGTNDPWRAVRLALIWGLGHMIPLLAVTAIGLGVGIGLGAGLGPIVPPWAVDLIEGSGVQGGTSRPAARPSMGSATAR